MTEGPEAAAPACDAHAQTACAPCLRCGAFVCEKCAGEAPNTDLCRACDTRVGTIPWERDRARLGVIGAWLRTVSNVTFRPSNTARRLPTDGPLREPIAFAASVLVVHAIGMIAVLTAVTSWQVSSAMEAFGIPESVGRSLVAIQVAHRGVVATLTTVAVASAGPLLWTTAARVVGVEVTLRDATRAVAYACGLLVATVVPLVGIAMPVVLAYYFSAWLTVRATLPVWKHAVAMVVVAFLAVGIALLVDLAYEHTLGVVVTDVIFPPVDR